MTGLEYEYQVAKYLERHGYNHVEVTKASGDYGIDVIAHKHGRKYAVQCKYYSHPVSLDAVQEAFAGKSIYNCDEAMVVTNSTFTASARHLAEANKVILLERVSETFEIFPRWSKAKAALLCVYLFISSALLYANWSISKDLPFFSAAYNYISVILLVSIPLWIKPALHGIWKLFKFLTRKLRHKENAVVFPEVEQTEPSSELPASLALEINKAKSDLQHTVNAVNTVSDPSLFFTNLHKTLDILLFLQQFEGYGTFSNSTPTADFAKILANLENTVDDFLDRAIYEANLKSSQYDNEDISKEQFYKFACSLSDAFDSANYFWQGDKDRPHYKGILFTDKNYQRVEKLKK